MLALCLLALSGPAEGLQEAWWDPAWPCRRSLSVRNAGDAAFPKGLPVELELDPAFLRPGGPLDGLALVRAGIRIGHVARPSADGRRLLVAFPLAAELAPGATDAGYALYYGNLAAPAPAGSPFPFFQDFSTGEGPDLGGLAGSTRGGALEIRDAPAERRAETPERIDLKTGRVPEAFAMSFDLEAAAGAPALALVLELTLHDPALSGVDPKPAAEWVERLGADDVEERERAARALAALGAAALPALADAAFSKDPELRARVRRVLAEVRKKAPPAVIRAGLVGSEFLWKTAEVGGARSSQGASRPADGSPRRFRFEIERGPEGMVTVSCDGQRLQRKPLKGPVERVSIAVWKSAPGRPAPLRLDNLFLRAFVDPEERPVTTLDVERLRP